MATVSIFVSHSHEDDAYCRALVAALRDAGADVWYDEHNLGAGHLMNEIQKELERRPIFIVILSKAAFASRWVRHETGWAYDLWDHDRERMILPVTAKPIESSDFSGAAGWMFLKEFKRIEHDFKPYSQSEAIGRTLHALALTPAGEEPILTETQPNDTAKELIERGKALQAQGKHEEALPLFERATAFDLLSFDAWYNRTRALLYLGRHKEALISAKQALELDPKSANAWNAKGVTLNALKQNKEALEAFQQALELDPKLVNALINKAAILNALGNRQKAVAAYGRALELDPKRVDIWVNWPRFWAILVGGARH